MHVFVLVLRHFSDYSWKFDIQIIKKAGIMRGEKNSGENALRRGIMREEKTLVEMSQRPGEWELEAL